MYNVREHPSLAPRGPSPQPIYCSIGSMDINRRRQSRPDSVTFESWFPLLWERHTKELTFQEIRKAVQALSRAYVEAHPRRIASALGSAGKRAGFALFYGPLHFLLLGNICRELEFFKHTYDRIVDLGCGTGVSGAACAVEARGQPEILGIDQNSWAVQEAGWTYRVLGLRGNARLADLTRVRLPGLGSGIVAAFTVNELGAGDRERLKTTLLEAASRGSAVLVIEPIARRLAPWWKDWAQTFLRAGGRADDWRFEAALPERLKLMDKAAGLDHRELTGRSLWLPGNP